MDLILRETSLYYNEERVADITFIEGNKAFLDNPAHNTIIIEDGEFEFTGAENLAQHIIYLTHEWASPSMSVEGSWFEEIKANGVTIGTSILSKVDTVNGKLNIVLSIVDDRFTADCMEYDINCNMQDMTPEEIVASFYVATRHILPEIKLNR